METKIDIFEKIIAKIQDKVDYADIRAGTGNNRSEEHTSELRH